MRKFLAVGIVLALTVFFTNAASACQVSCGGGSCSGSGDCHCDGSSPHCTDATKVSPLYVQYLQTWNTPGLNRVADAASRILDASNANDLEAYQTATRNYNAALEKLTKTERQIIYAWEAEAHETAPGPRQN